MCSTMHWLRTVVHIRPILRCTQHLLTHIFYYAKCVYQKVDILRELSLFYSLLRVSSYTLRLHFSNYKSKRDRQRCRAAHAHMMISNSSSYIPLKCPASLVPIQFSDAYTPAPKITSITVYNIFVK